MSTTGSWRWQESFCSNKGDAQSAALRIARDARAVHAAADNYHVEMTFIHGASSIVFSLGAWPLVRCWLKLPPEAAIAKAATGARRQTGPVSGSKHDQPGFLSKNHRGGRVESFHRGSIAVIDASGGVVFSAGDIERLVYPRSAIKAIQALVMVESGAVERFGLDDAEIALATASHMGELEHAQTALSMLHKAGRDIDALECGSHWPSSSGAVRALAAAGLKPSALHNNCSGKHAGFICAACASDIDPAGYVQPRHPTRTARRRSYGGPDRRAA